MAPSRPHRRRLWICLALAAAFLAAAVPPAVSGRLDDIEKRQERLDHRDANLAEEQRGLAGKVAYWDRLATKVQVEVNRLDGELRKLDSRIEETRQDLTEKQVRLAFLTDELQGIQTDLVAATDVFAARAVAAYKAGPDAYVDSLLSSESFSDLLDRYAYYQAALKSDSELVAEIENMRDTTDLKRDQVEEAKNEIAEQKLALETDREEVAAVRRARADVLQQRSQILAEKEGLLRGVKRNRTKIAMIQRQLEADSARIAASLSGSGGGTFPVGGGQLLWPAAGPVTSGYGYRTHPIFGDQRLHTGIDIGADYGGPVIAADGGQVVFVGAMSGYGNVVVIDHGGGLATTYNHLSGFSVVTGQTARRGQLIASVGCTGYCTGPHLHFEVRVNGTPVDPMPYLQ